MLDYNRNAEEAMAESDKFCFDRRPEPFCRAFVDR